VAALGLILLIATPILCVTVSLVGFALLRDRAYMMICAVVLIVLLISFFLSEVQQAAAWLVLNPLNWPHAPPIGLA
jgi:uncharacterized membrane protein